MKTDITDQIHADLRDRWLRYFEDASTFQDTLERILIAQASIMRRQRITERSLWKQLVPALNISHEITDYQLAADFDKQRLFLTGPELPPQPIPEKLRAAYENTTGCGQSAEPTPAPETGQVV